MMMKAVIRKMVAVSNFISSRSFQYAKDREKANREADTMIRDARSFIAEAKAGAAKKLLQSQREYKAIEAVENISKWYSPDMWNYYLKEKLKGGY